MNEGARHPPRKPDNRYTAPSGARLMVNETPCDGDQACLGPRRAAAVQPSGQAAGRGEVLSFGKTQFAEFCQNGACQS
jgi:hypothetical protein